MGLNMYKMIISVLLALALVGCQSSGSGKSDSEPNSGRKIGDSPESGSLFSSVFTRKQSQSIALPPDLVSSASDQVQANHARSEADKKNRVLPEVVAARIVGDGDKRWLRVDSDAQNVWDTLADFWAAEQVELVEYRPAAGQMETDWISANSRTSEGTRGEFIKTLFNRAVGQGVVFDKFKIRLERIGDNSTDVYVSHRSTEKQQAATISQQKLTQYEWVDTGGDPEKVAQLLQVMVLLFESSDTTAS